MAAAQNVAAYLVKARGFASRMCAAVSSPAGRTRGRTTEWVRAPAKALSTKKVLPSADGFSVARELPADKNAKLVFYCANTH